MSDSKAVRGPREKGSEGRTSIPTFYRQVVAELRKVVWPTQEQLVTYFTVVMVFVLVMMAHRLGAGPRVRQAGVRGLHRPHRAEPRPPGHPQQQPEQQAMERSVSEQYDEQDVQVEVEETDDLGGAEGVAEDALVESVLEEAVADEPSEDELFAADDDAAGDAEEAAADDLDDLDDPDDEADAADDADEPVEDATDEDVAEVEDAVEDAVEDEVTDEVTADPADEDSTTRSRPATRTPPTRLPTRTRRDEDEAAGDDPLEAFRAELWAQAGRLVRGAHLLRHGEPGEVQPGEPDHQP